MQNGWAGQASREKDGELGAAFGRNVSATICSSVKGQATIERSWVPIVNAVR
jgi:hypothetical protein